METFFVFSLLIDEDWIIDLSNIKQLDFKD